MAIVEWLKGTLVEDGTRKSRDEITQPCSPHGAPEISCYVEGTAIRSLVMPYGAVCASERSAAAIQRTNQKEDERGPREGIIQSRWQWPAQTRSELLQEGKPRVDPEKEIEMGGGS